MGNYYSQELLDEASTPANWREWEADASERCHNASCGDSLAVRAKFSGDHLENVEWFSAGCSLSKAAASVMSQVVTGMTQAEILQIDLRQVQDHLDLEYLSPGRIKCILLFVSCLQRQINLPKNQEEL